MKNAVTEITRFQTDRDLHTKEFDTVNENANIAEEMLEAHGYDVDKADRPKLKMDWRAFFGSLKYTKKVKNLTKAMIVDAYCDIVVFAIGAILKLGYDPEKALLEVAKEINSREGSMVDGKFEKDLSPEAQAKWYKADYDGQALRGDK